MEFHPERRSSSWSQADSVAAVGGARGPELHGQPGAARGADYLTGVLADGRIGEGWAGTDPNGSHVNLVVARRGSPTAAAVVGALAAPRPGYLPFLACLERGAVVRPTTVVVNKTALETDAQSRIVWGAGQLGVAQGVLDAVADATVAPEDAPELLLLVALWIDAAAHDEAAVRTATRKAVHAALAAALRPSTVEDVAALVARREQANNPWYGEGTGTV
jgi:formaldehyde-activating enzyme